MEEFVRRREVQWAVVAFLTGVVLGLVMLGWWLWPVEWTDAVPADLREDQQEAYILTVAQAYELNGNVALARQRLSSFDEGAAGTILWQAVRRLTREGKVPDAQQLTRLGSDLGLESGTPTVKTPSLWERLSDRSKTAIFILAVLLVAVLAGALFFSRRGQLHLPSARPQPDALAPVESPRPALKSFTASYSLGDDDYKQSFYIDGPTGEFLGECGIKRSMAIGEGSPQHVTAFEVWLFDKREIRTTTKVLASPYAYQDEETRSRLLTKGDIVVAHPGSLVLLETEGMTMEAEVLQCTYSQDESIGPRSYFDNLVLQLTPLPKSQYGF